MEWNWQFDPKCRIRTWSHFIRQNIAAEVCVKKRRHYFAVEVETCYWARPSTCTIHLEYLPLCNTSFSHDWIARVQNGKGCWKSLPLCQSHKTGDGWWLDYGARLLAPSTVLIFCEMCESAERSVDYVLNSYHCSEYRVVRHARLACRLKRGMVDIPPLCIRRNCGAKLYAYFWIVSTSPHSHRKQQNWGQHNQKLRNF